MIRLFYLMLLYTLPTQLLADPWCEPLSRYTMLTHDSISKEPNDFYENKAIIELTKSVYHHHNTGSRAHLILKGKNKLLNIASFKVRKDYNEKLKAIKNTEYRPFPSSLLGEYISLLEQGNRELLACIGHIHSYGIGIEPNNVKAWAWYDAAKAEFGDPLRGIHDNARPKLTDEELREAIQISDQLIKLYTTVPDPPSVSIIQSSERVK